MITNETINHAINFIMQHIDEEISVEDVARECHFSKYYFERLFKEETGESIYEFIKRVKLEQSAFRLKVERGRSITDIGEEYGYSASNYSTVFKQHHHISPVNFRKRVKKPEELVKHPFFMTDAAPLENFEQCNSHITIEEVPDYFVVYERSIGSYFELGNHWSAFCEKYSKYQTEDAVLIERTYDDPTITDTMGCLYDICMTISPDTELTNTTWIQGGRFAVYHFKGEVKDIFLAYQAFFSVWLARSGHEIDKRYGLDIYHSIDSSNMYVDMDLCIPIK